MRALPISIALLLVTAIAHASPQLERAKREDAALRRSEEKLRVRDNITRVIDRWREAQETAKTDAEKREASRGIVEAWVLLARWSGRTDDADRAKTVAKKLEVHRLRKVEVEGTSLVIDASGDYSIRSGTYGERRLYFDLSPLAAVKEALGEVKLASSELEQVRVTQLDVDTVRIIVDGVAAIPPHTMKRDRIELELNGGLNEIVADVKAELKKTDSLLVIRKVVIDAGHGGRDTGAIGQGEIREKDINLAIAKRVGQELEKIGVEVAYTRTSDRFMSLEKRASIANRSAADLYLSIHANSNRSNRIHGIETYYLDTSSSRYASRLARRENGQGEEPDLDPEEASEASELPDGTLGADLRLILADLAMRSAATESKRLAGYVQSSMIRSLRSEHRDVKDLGVKHALFAVLLGVRMPAVLIETGFVTHPTESERLQRAAYQAKIAKAVARGVERLMEERQRLAVVR